MKHGDISDNDYHQSCVKLGAVGGYVREPGRLYVFMDSEGAGGEAGEDVGTEQIIGIKPDASGLHRNSQHSSFLYLFCCQHFQNNLIKAKAVLACCVRWQEARDDLWWITAFLSPSLFTGLKCAEACHNANECAINTVFVFALNNLANKTLQI